MIVISAAGVVIAILLLVVGMITSNLLFVYISIGVSVAAAILLTVGVFRRRDLFVRETPADTGAAGGAAAAQGKTATGARPAGARTGSQQAALAGEQTAGDDVAAAERTSGRVLAGAAHSAFETSQSAAASAPPDSDIVLVVPGRRRFHVPGCIHLTRRRTEELTVDEALEEGFSACTTCLPGSAPDPWAAGQDAAATSTAAIPEPAPSVRTLSPAHKKPSDPAAWAKTLNVPRPSEPTVALGAGDDLAGASADPGEDLHADTAPDEEDGPSADVSAQPREGAKASAGGPTATVWVVRGVSRHHLRDCVLIRVVDDEDVDTMTLAEARRLGCTPCRACHTD